MRLLRPCYSHSSKGNWSLRDLGFRSDAVSGVHSSECVAASLCYWCPWLRDNVAVSSSRVFSKCRAPITQWRGATFQTNGDLKLKFPHVKNWERIKISTKKLYHNTRTWLPYTLASTRCKFHETFRYFLLGPRQEKGKLYFYSWDSVVSTRLRVGRSGAPIPAGAIHFPLLKKFQTDSGNRPASYSMGTGVFPGLQPPGREVDHSPPSSAEVKNKWS
jgi:hypothetical protein